MSRLILLVLGVMFGAVGVLLVQAFTPISAPGESSSELERDPHIVMTFSDEVLTAFVQRSINRGISPIPLENVHVASKDGRLVVTGTAVPAGQTGIASGLRVNGMIALSPSVQDGRLRFNVVESKLGTLSLPRNLQPVLDEPINREVANALSPLHATITGVQVVDDGLSVSARVDVPALLTTAAPQP